MFKTFTFFTVVFISTCELLLFVITDSRTSFKSVAVLSSILLLLVFSQSSSTFTAFLTPLKSPIDEKGSWCVSSGKQIRSPRNISSIITEGMHSMLATSHISHHDEKNDGNTIAALSRNLSKMHLSWRSEYKGQRHRPGTAGGTASSSTRSTGSWSNLVANSNAKSKGFGTPSRGGRKQNRKRQGDDNDPTHPNKYLTHDEEDVSAECFLCPCYVKNRYPMHPCFNQPFKRTADVRQHLARCHIQVSHCPVCGMIFHSDRADDDRATHIREVACNPQPYFIPGISRDQWNRISALANPRNRSRLSSKERWMMMWRVIYPDVADPESPYHSGQTNLIQGMLDIRASIVNAQSLATSTIASFTSFGPHEMAVIEAFIGAARQLQHGQHGQHGTMALADSSHTPSNAPASVPFPQGQSFPASLPTSTQHQPAEDLAWAEIIQLAADAEFQWDNHFDGSGDFIWGPNHQN